MNKKSKRRKLLPFWERLNMMFNWISLKILKERRRTECEMIYLMDLIGIERAAWLARRKEHVWWMILCWYRGSKMIWASPTHRVWFDVEDKWKQSQEVFRREFVGRDMSGCITFFRSSAAFNIASMKELGYLEYCPQCPEAVQIFIGTRIIEYL